MTAGEVSCEVCGESYEPCDGHRCDGGLAQQVAINGQLVAEKRALVRALLWYEDPKNNGKRTASTIDGVDVTDWRPIDEDEGKLAREALAAVGLDTEDSREALRSQLAAETCDMCESAPGFCPRHDQKPVVAGHRVE